MSVVEISGGPWTHRYLMNRTKDWIASNIRDLSRLVDPEAPQPDRNELLDKPKWDLAKQALDLSRRHAAKLGSADG